MVFGLETGGVEYEKNISTEQNQTRKNPWFLS
jgi:hypothetical protein